MIKKQISTLFFTTIVILVFNAIFVSFSYNSISEHAGKSQEYEISSLDSFLDEKIRLLMFTGYIPSLSACIIHNESVVWSNGYGFYDFRGLKQPSMDTIYQVASVSKTVTATAILQLYEKGLFDLDDDVNLYLPFSLRNPKYPDAPISFRMLLCHHTSLHDHDEVAAYEYFAGDYPLSFVEELLVPGGEAYHAEFWGNYPPGGGGNYSNIGFTVLGFLVELLSGQTFEEYCQQHIFMPLRMDDTSFEMDDLPCENIACSYIRFGRLYIKVPHMDYTFIDPCGGLLTTPDDLSRFLIAHMNKGVYQGVRILGEEVIQEMHRVQYPKSEPYFGTLRFGLGWLVFEEEFGRKTHGHDGDLTFSHARMRILQDNTTGIIYFFNKGFRPSIGPRTLSSMMEYGSDALIRKMLYDKANERVYGNSVT
jgi:CubicO group peptidase (beta-lactamase class C family)